MFKHAAVGVLCLGIASTSAHARELKFVTWNLGWDPSRDEAADWIQKCGAPFALNQQTGIFEPAEKGTPGWELKWGRDANIDWDIAVRPPCDVSKDSSFDIVPVTTAAYGKRLDQIQAFISSKLQPDIISFQEVSGEQAVKDALPSGGADYFICSFTTHKVQRLAIAWKREFGPATECAVEGAISVPGLPPKDQVRPGLSLALNIDGQRVRVLDVHLKSSCVTPIEPKGALESAEEPCTILQQQVVPLETWIETKTADTDKLVIMGDFNRSLWHEQHSAGSVRTDSSDPAGPLPATVKVKSLIGEVNDGAPPASRLTLLNEGCAINDAAKAACETAENPSTLAEWKDATKTLSRFENLGCRNPVGLDHILLGTGLSAPGGAQKVALGKQGRSLPANADHPDPLLALSDHCPLAATASF